MEVVNIKEFKIENKKRKVKDWFKTKCQDGKSFAIRNKDQILAFTPVFIGGVATLYKGASKRANLRKMEDIKDLRCYDNKLGHYWKLRRELTNDEWLEIDRRKRNGEPLSDILEQLKVLK